MIIDLWKKLNMPWKFQVREKSGSRDLIIQFFERGVNMNWNETTCGNQDESKTEFKTKLYFSFHYIRRILYTEFNMLRTRSLQTLIADINVPATMASMVSSIVPYLTYYMSHTGIWKIWYFKSFLQDFQLFLYLFLYRFHQSIKCYF